jgi:DNA (cytosine-5)-methyltransferase 1
LDDKLVEASRYVSFINEKAFRELPPFEDEPENNRPRNHNVIVQKRFHLFQIMRDLSPNARREIGDFLKTGNQSLITRTSRNELANSGWPSTTDGEGREKLPWRSLLAALEPLQTKKRTQRALVAKDPAPAAVSIPDDACHYRDGTLRTLTVREMARIQSFPDWFKFCNKITTGGQMRRFQVPQYTQVGNAVPPLLGRALGQICKDLLELAK